MRFPYTPVEFTAQGRAADATQPAAALDMMRDTGASDVLLLVHGWNNDMQRARALYEQLADNMADLVGDLPGPRVAVIGVFWPSIGWADEDEVAGDGAFAADPRSALDAAIEESVEDAEVARSLRAAADCLEVSTQARADFLAALRRLLPAAGVAGEDPVPEALTAGDADAVFAAAEEAELLAGDGAEFAPAAGVPADPAGSSPDPLAGAPATGVALGWLPPLVTARRLLNLTTYYTMKDRAGTVGSRGVADLLGRLHRDAPEARVHLAGHSFGARVVAAAAATSTVAIHSATLLQGAFSHFGFAANYGGSGKDGAFRRAVTGAHMKGPIVVTHTHNDRAVRTAYAIASRLARQVGSLWGGGRDDPYGGIGANGAVETREADSVTLQDVGHRYAFRPGRIYNLRSDRYISGHGSVTGKQVAHALLSAMTATP